MPENPHVALGPVGRIWRWAKESSSWITRIFAGLLIVYLSFKAGISYVDHPDRWEEFSDRAFVFSGFMILLIGSVIREASRIRKERYANIFDKLQAISSEAKDLNVFLIRQLEREGDVDVKTLKSITLGEVQRILNDLSDIFSMVTGRYAALRSS